MGGCECLGELWVAGWVVGVWVGCGWVVGSWVVVGARVGCECLVVVGELWVPGWVVGA